jgi:hypothetical protein
LELEQPTAAAINPAAAKARIPERFIADASIYASFFPPSFRIGTQRRRA